MSGNSDFIMRQEQYYDLLREAGQERLLQAGGVQPSRLTQLFGWLSGLLGGKRKHPKHLPRLKRVAL